MKLNRELWKSIRNFDNYEISNLGNVRSIDRFFKDSINRMQFHRGRILKNQKTKSGYYQVTLSKINTFTYFRNHQLVLTHFGPKKPTPKHQVNHIDGNKLNNWYKNLEWVTHQENGQHAYDIGLHLKMFGENNPAAKLNKQKVKKIRNLYMKGIYYQKELSKIFGVSKNCIFLIVNNKTWVGI